MDIQTAESAQEQITGRKSSVSAAERMAKARAGWTAETAKRRRQSRIANGTAIIPGVDGNSVWVRRLKELLEQMVADKGGIENISASEHHIMRRALVLVVECERIEARFAAGDAKLEDLDTYARIASSMRRLLESVGLQRRPRAINGPSLSDLMREDLQRQQQMHIEIEVQP